MADTSLLSVFYCDHKTALLSLFFAVCYVRVCVCAFLCARVHVLVCMSVILHRVWDIFVLLSRQFPGLTNAWAWLTKEVCRVDSLRKR